MKIRACSRKVKTSRMTREGGRWRGIRRRRFELWVLRNTLCQIGCTGTADIARGHLEAQTPRSEGNPSWSDG